MKKKLIIVSIFLSLVTFIYTISYKVKANNDSDKLVINIEEEQKNLYGYIQKSIDSNVYLINNDTYFIKENLTIEGKINKYIYDDNNVIFTIKELNNDCIYKYNLITSEKQLIDKLPIIVNDMVIYNDQLIIVGEEDNDACIYVYTKDGIQICKYQYGGIAKESFLRIKICNNYMYIIGQKNGISEGSIFKNVGNNDDIKPFIIKMNSSFKVVNEFYINIDTEYERLNNFDFDSFDGNISFTVETFDKRFFHYELDYELQLVKHYELLLPIKYTNISKLNNKSYLIKNVNYYYLGFKDIDTWHIVSLTDINKVDNVELVNGNIVITNYSNNQINTYKISEYHIEYIDDFIYQYPYYDYQSTNHFKVESYLEQLNFVYDNVANQSINLQKSANYIAKYYAIKQDQSLINIETNYIVEPFINIINEGVYQIGYKIFFTDEVIMNDVKIINGETLQEPGIYILKHNGKNYTIYVKEKIYHSFGNDYLNADCFLTKYDKAIYQITLNSNKQVSKVIVNEEEYPFIQNENEIVLNFAIDNNNFVSYYIDSIVFSDNSNLKINKRYTLKRVLDYPTLKLTYDNDILNYQIIDEDRTIFDVVVKMYKETVLLEEVHSFLENTNVIFNLDTTKVEVCIRYHLEGTTYEEISLIDIDAIKKSQKDDNLELTFEKNNDIVECIKIKINDETLKLKNVSAQKINLTAAYQTTDNKLICYISIIVTAILLVIIVSVIIRKRVLKSKR